MAHALALPTLPPVAAPVRRQLLAATALVVVVHALLLLGLPAWLALATRAGADSSAFVIRMVPAPVADLAPPAPTPVEPAAVQPKPPPPPPRHVKPPPKHSAPVTPKAEPQAPPVVQPPVPPAPASPAVASAGTDPDATLLAPPPLVALGGGVAAADLTPPLPAATASAALAAAAAAVPGPSLPVRIAPSARLTYHTAGNFGGQAIELATTLDWRRDDAQYAARWVLYSPRAGDYTRTSTGLLTPQGLLPVLAALRPPDGPNIRFDYDTRQLHFAGPSAPDTSSAQTAPFTPGAQDRLAALLQLGALLAGDPARYPVGSQLDIPAAHYLQGQEMGAWRFSVEAEEPLTALNGQTLATLRLLHQSTGENDPRIEVWLARQLDYLPARLRITETNGDTVEHTITAAYTQQVNVRPAPAPGPAPAALPPAPSPSPAQPVSAQ